MQFASFSDEIAVTSVETSVRMAVASVTSSQMASLVTLTSTSSGELTGSGRGYRHRQGCRYWRGEAGLPPIGYRLNRLITSSSLPLAISPFISPFISPSISPFLFSPSRCYLFCVWSYQFSIQIIIVLANTGSCCCNNKNVTNSWGKKLFLACVVCYSRGWCEHWSGSEPGCCQFDSR